jgi:hypothetical protein
MRVLLEADDGDVIRQLTLYRLKQTGTFALVEGKKDQVKENAFNAVQSDFWHGLDYANRSGGQIGGQRGNKRHGIDTEQVMSSSDAAAAAVRIGYYEWKFGDEAYSCKGSTVRPCNWQGE